MDAFGGNGMLAVVSRVRFGQICWVRLYGIRYSRSSLVSQACLVWSGWFCWLRGLGSLCLHWKFELIVVGLVGLGSGV